MKKSKRYLQEQSPPLYTMEEIDEMFRILCYLYPQDAKDIVLFLIDWTTEHPDEREECLHRDCLDFSLINEAAFELYRTTYTKEESEKIFNWLYNVAMQWQEDGYVNLSDKYEQQYYNALVFWKTFIPIEVKTKRKRQSGKALQKREQGNKVPFKHCRRLEQETERYKDELYDVLDAEE